MSSHTQVDPQHRFITLPDGRRVAIAEYGDPGGRTLLALHGAPASRLMFAVAGEAAKRHGLRLIAPDRPGYGLTPPDTGERSLASYGDDIAAIADALGLSHVGLIGVSGGAPYAVAAAARLGDRVTVLALVSPLGPIADLGKDVAIHSAQRWFFLKVPRTRVLLGLGARAFVAGFKLAPRLCLAVFARALGGPDRVTLLKPGPGDQLIAMTAEAVRQGPVGAMADMAVFGRPWDVVLANVTAPAILWQGTADRIVPPQASFHLARLLPSCRVARIEGAGHFWVLEHVDEVLGEIAAMGER